MRGRSERRGFGQKKIRKGLRFSQPRASGPTRDEAVGFFSATLAYEDSALALNWAATISNPQMRQSAEEQIANEWLKQNPAAAKDWFQNSSLPEAEKARLLEANPGP